MAYSSELEQYKDSLSVEQRKQFEINLRRAIEISPDSIQPVDIHMEKGVFAWICRRENSSDIDGYVVTREINILGINSIKIGSKTWTCECGDFIFRCQKLDIPCKHILAILLLDRKAKESF